MSADSSDRVQSLYQRMLTLPPDERDAFLAETCDDPDVRKEVRSLLRARKEATGFFDGLTEDVVGPLKRDAIDREDWSLQSERLLDREIGRYRLAEEIGVGGMSVVYRAERVGDFEQTVAVKLLQRRLHASGAEDRFRAERQVLASLDHPNIASLIDGGVTEGGRPYLVMEYVDGVPITTYAGETNLDAEQRLDLLEQVIRAVQVAHRQLVVHRDLKPSNVLVTETDDGPQVKLLDFGIAKLLDDSLPVTRPQTRTGHHLMTPAYASPEQVTGEEITTATDVYQLGVLAYELLAGVRPYDLEGKSLSEIERIVMDEMPREPSARTDDGIPNGGSKDLDTVILTALRKEPERRYRSVEALAADIERLRSGEPIEARSATLAYRARKFVARNKTAVAGALTIGVLLIAYAVTVTIQANRLETQRDRARTQAAKAEQVSDFLVNLISTTDPYRARGDGGKTVTLSTVLNRGADRVERLDDQPSVQAELQNVIGRIYDKLGSFEKAEPMLEASLAQRRQLHSGPDSTIATSLFNLALHHHLTGDYERADSLLRDVLAMRRKIYTPPHRKLAEVLGRLGSISWYNLGDYAAADSLLHQALRMRKSVSDSANVSLAAGYNDLANLYHRQGKFDRAAPYYRKAIEMYRGLEGPHPAVATIMSNFAGLLNDRGQYATADTMQQQALAIHRKHAGEESIDVAIRMVSLGEIRMMRGQLAAAESLIVEGRKRQRQFYDPPHPYLARTEFHLANLRLRQGRLDAAEERLRAARSLARRSLPPGHPVRANSLVGLGRLHLKQGRPEAAESPLQEALSIRTSAFGDGNWRVAVAKLHLGRSLLHQNEYAGADTLLAAAYETLRSERPEDEPYRERARTAVARFNEATNQRQQEVHRRQGTVEAER